MFTDEQIQLISKTIVEEANKFIASEKEVHNVITSYSMDGFINLFLRRLTPSIKKIIDTDNNI